MIKYESCTHKQLHTRRTFDTRKIRKKNFTQAIEADKQFFFFTSSTALFWLHTNVIQPF